MTLRQSTRDTIASLFRRLPSFRGKATLGTPVINVLSRYDDPDECIVHVPMRDGSTMKIDLRSRTERWTYVTGTYEESTVRRLVASIDRPHCTVLDVGANIGFFTVPLARKVQQLGGALHAFEPVESNFRCLNYNVQLNGLGGTAHLHRLALGAKEGTIDLFLETENNASTGNAVAHPGMAATSHETRSSAPIQTLDHVAKEIGLSSCHLIKVDIEGAEYEFLKGGSSFLREHRPILFGEFNPFWLRANGHRFADVANLVLPWGYRLFGEDEKGGFSEVEQITDDLHDVLFLPRDLPASTVRILTRADG